MQWTLRHEAVAHMREDFDVNAASQMTRETAGFRPP
jgi:hypothetical protein